VVETYNGTIMLIKSLVIPGRFLYLCQMNEVLNKYHEEGLVYKQLVDSLTIWNYSRKVQYENLWDDVTLQTRGLVTDDKGKIVPRPFGKFFNMEEGKHTATS